MTETALRPWQRVAGGLFAVGWGANQFSSLIVAYRLDAGVSVTTTQALFGCYAVGLIPALLVSGPISDRVGRRACSRVALVLSLAATVFLMFGAHVIGPLYVGRFLAGVASGAIFAPATAWVKELSAAPHDRTAGEQSGARRAAIALSAGFGVGPLVAGAVAQWSPAPLIVSYIPHLAVLALAAALVWTAPETVLAPRRISLRVDAALDPRFRIVVAPAAPWVFLAPSVSMAVLPGLVGSHTHGLQVAFAALACGVTLGVGVLVQPIARRLGGGVAGLSAGLTSIAVGCLVAAEAASTENPLLALVSAVLLGAGYGFVLVSGLLEAQRIAAPEQLAGLTAVYYALTYLGFGAPLVLAALHGVWSYPTLLLAVAALAALTAVWVRTRRTASTAPVTVAA